MEEFKIKVGTHIVIKKADAAYYLNPMQQTALLDIINTIRDTRLNDGKKDNEYLVINTDEPYADEIREVIKRGELAKLGGH